MEVIERMLFLAFVLHRRCIVRQMGQNIDYYVAVPSLRGRPGIHPFAQVMADAGLTQDSPQLVAAPDAKSDERITSADQFVLPSGTDYPERTCSSSTTPGPRVHTLSRRR